MHEVQMAYWLTSSKDFLLDKFAIHFTRCLQACFILSTWKIAVIILIHKKGDLKDKKNCHLMSIVYSIQLFFKSAKLYSNQLEDQLAFQND